MSASGVDDTFGNRSGLMALIFIAIIVTLFTWTVFSVMGGQAKRASKEFNSPGYPATNSSLPLRF